MSVEHANQLRQLIVGNIVPNQPNQLTHILQSLSTIASVLLHNPKSFPSHASWQAHKKILFHETASACHITPLGHLERPREGSKKCNKTSFWYNYHLYYFPTQLGFLFNHRSRVHLHLIVDLHTSQKTPDQ